MSYLVGQQCCECVKQHGAAALSTGSQSSRCLLVLPHPPSAMFRESSLGFGFLSAAQVNSFLGGGTFFMHPPP